MGKNERQAYLKAIRTRYRRASKRAKAEILDEFCAVCGYLRKYAMSRIFSTVPTGFARDEVRTVRWTKSVG